MNDLPPLSIAPQPELLGKSILRLRPVRKKKPSGVVPKKRKRRRRKTIRLRGADLERHRLRKRLAAKARREGVLLRKLKDRCEAWQRVKNYSSHTEEYDAWRSTYIPPVVRHGKEDAKDYEDLRDERRQQLEFGACAELIQRHTRKAAQWVLKLPNGRSLPYKARDLAILDWYNRWHDFYAARQSVSSDVLIK